LVPAIRERLRDVAELTPLAPSEERFRLFDAVSQFVLAMSARRPVVILLDDLHWADQGTLALLRHVARFAPQHPLLLIGTYRDADVGIGHPLTALLAMLRRESCLERIPLGGLSNSETADLVAALAACEVSEATVASIRSATQGNPFFVGEMVQHLR